MRRLLRAAHAFTQRHAEEGVGWAVALAAALYAGAASGAWTPVAAIAALAVAARWGVAVAIRERRLQREGHERAARRRRALRPVAEAAGRLRRDLIATDALVLRRAGLPDMNIDDVATSIREGHPVHRAMAWDTFESWSSAASAALQRFSSTAAPHVPDLSPEDCEVLAEVAARGDELVAVLDALAQLAGGDFAWAQKDHSRRQFPERVAEIEAAANAHHASVARLLGRLSEVTLTLAKRAYN